MNIPNATTARYPWFPVAFLACAGLVASGCARLGQPLDMGLPITAGTDSALSGAPGIAEILEGLAANDSAVVNFKAAGAFVLESPDLSGVKKFNEGLIAFRRPADLCVIGRKYLGTAVFRLTCVGEEFLIEFPATREEPYYRIEGERFESVPFSVSPADIAREMFLPEDWRALKSREVRMTAYDETAQTAVLEIGPKRAPRRRVEVWGPPWVVVRSERLDESGNVIALTTKPRESYRDVEGLHFPAQIEARFPGEQTRMSFDMRRIYPNTELDKSLFDIKSRAAEVGIDLSAARREKHHDRPRHDDHRP